MTLADADATADVPADEPTPRPQRLARFRIRIFSSASDEPRARRPSDAVLLVATAVGIALCQVAAPGGNRLDEAAGNLVQDLPGLFGGIWEIAYDLLIGWSLFLLVTALVAHARKRLFRDLVLAALASLLLAALAGAAAGTELSTSLEQLSASTSPPVYLAVRLAVATAVIAAASPHMAQPLRRAGRWVIALGALASVALDTTSSLGTIAAFLVGIAAAAIIHLLFGSPGGRLSLSEVADALAEIGVEAVDLRSAPLEPRGVEVVLGTTPEGRPLTIKIFGRDAQQGQLISSTWSSLRRRGETVRLAGNWQQVQHEAFVSLLAERGGASVVSVVAAGTAPDGDALLVLDGEPRPLGSLSPEEVDDRVIGQLWEAFGRLGELGIAFRRVDSATLFVRDDGTAAVGEFGDAAVAAGDGAIQADRAQLLVVTALLVGPERAVPLAVRAIGNLAVEACLPYLQHAALTSEVGRAVKRCPWDLEALRLRAEQETGSAPMELEQLRRVTWGSLLKLGLIGLVAYALISAVANVGLATIAQEFKSADKGWLLAALILAPLIQIPQAFSTLGATLRPMKFFPVLMLQYGVQFIALAVPSSAARVALEIRFFERVGVPAAGAVSIGMIDSFSTFCIQILLMIVITVSGLASLGLWGSSTSGSGSGSSIDWGALATAIVLLAIAFGAALLVPRFRALMKRFLDGLRSKAADGREALKVLRHPRKLVYLLGGNLVAQVLTAILLGFCVEAFGHSATLAQLILINCFASMFAGFMPVPGGVGVAEAAYSAGLVAIGIPHSAAASAAIMFRLVTFYLPPIWGGFAMRWMRANRYL